MRTLALIPARAGSKGIPHKNTREFLGKPLVAHAIEVGKATCDATLVSTDDVRVAEIAARWDVPVIWRPRELAQDDTPMLPVIQHAMGYEDADVVVLLQPTSPLARRAAVVMGALSLLRDSDAASVASVVEIPTHYNPDRALEITYDGVLRRYDKPEGEGGLGSFPARRQDSAPGYYFDGTVYAVRERSIRRGLMFGSPCRPLIIPAHESATIDTEEDWALAEAKHG